MRRYALAVGSNRGDRAGIISAAAVQVTADGMIALTHRSTLHETAPVGGPPGQGAYLNGAWIVASDLGPHQVLHRLQAVESALGRVRTVRDGARTIDLDLLLSDDALVVATPALVLPHPRLHLRRFVLTPLAEIAREWRHPLLGRTVGELLSALSRGEG